VFADGLDNLHAGPIGEFVGGDDADDRFGVDRVDGLPDGRRLDRRK